MSYGAALPAGAYGRPLGAYHRRRETPSHAGASMRGAAMKRAVTLAGLSALGDVNLCNDPGWAFAQSLISGGGSIATTALAPTTTKVEGSTETTTSGGGAGYYAASGVTAVGDAWGAACEVQAANEAQVASQQNTAMLMAEMERQRQLQEQQIAAQRSNTEATLAAMMSMQQQQPQQSGGIDTNTLLIGGAIVGAGLIAVLLLR